MEQVTIQQLADAAELPESATALPQQGRDAFVAYLSEYETEQRYIKKDQ